MRDVTRILSAIEGGDSSAAEELLPVVYEELRKLAGERMAREAPGQTLQATALVHEAYIRLVDREEAQEWRSRGHFFAAAAEAMRRILIERARRKRRVRHGGGRKRLDLNVDLLDVSDEGAPEVLLELDAALQTLASEEPAAAEVVKLRFFAGLTAEATAASLGISLRTANRHWAFAKAWLFRELNRDGASAE